MIRQLSHCFGATARSVRVALGAVATIAIAALPAMPGQADEPYRLVVTSMLLDNTPNTAVQDWFLDELVARSDGRIELEQYRAGALCSGRETTACLIDGRADIGISVPAYTPEQFTLAELGALPFLTSDNQALMQAFYTLNQENETFRSETEKLGLVPIAYFSAGLSILGSKGKLEGPSDLEGTRVRAVGDGVVAAITAAEGQPVAVTASEMYEAAQRGIVDVVFNNMDAPTAYNLDEVLPYWVDAGYGHYVLVGIWMSQAAFDRLPEDLRAIVDDVTRDLNSGKGMQAYAAVARTQCDQLFEGGKIEGLSTWDDAAIAEWAALTGDGPKQRYVEKAAAAGYETPEKVLEQYLALLEDFSGTGVDIPFAECVKRFAAQ